MVVGRPKLGTFLLESGNLSEQQLDTAIEHQVTHGCRLGESLVALGYCTDALVAQALAEQLDIPFLDLEENPPSPACITLLPREVALALGVLPVRLQEHRLLVAVQDPYDIRVDEAVRQATGLHAVIAAAPPAQLRELLRQHYSETLLEEAQAHPPEESPELETDEQPASVESLIAAGKEVSTIRLVHTVIADAFRRGASDIHLEPEPGQVRVRHRIDGWMHFGVTLPGELHQSIVARLKIMGGMDISESRRPQDGSCSVRVDGRPVELRVATLRGIHGEIVVLRLLCPDSGLQQLDALGLRPSAYQDLRRLLAGRQGLFLITGPTGSGKSTTLYAALNYLNQERVNVITVEDPVESQLPGINQIQIHDRAGRSFASTLRSMLRQDPDIIMVGEIRDAETAEIACRAALTGHLVLSTLHTPDTLGAVTRLREMGVAPWLLGACLSGVLAQRLARRVCDQCAQEYTPPHELLDALTSQFGRVDGARFRKGRGCPACRKMGHRGRVGIHELLLIDPQARHLVAEGAPAEVLEAHVKRQGFTTIEQDAFRKACEGLIPPEEVVELGLGVASTMAGTAPAPPEPSEEPIEMLDLLASSECELAL
jgi:type IV pilus assembly protein PilB